MKQLFFILIIVVVSAGGFAQGEPVSGEANFEGKFVNFTYPKSWSLFSGDEAAGFMGNLTETEDSEQILIVKGDYTIESLESADEDQLMMDGFIMIAIGPDPFATMAESEDIPWYEIMFGNLEGEDGVQLFTKEEVTVAGVQAFHMRFIMDTGESSSDPALDTTVYAMRKNERLIVISSFSSPDTVKPAYAPVMDKLISSLLLK